MESLRRAVVNSSVKGVTGELEEAGDRVEVEAGQLMSLVATSSSFHILMGHVRALSSRLGPATNCTQDPLEMVTGFVRDASREINATVDCPVVLVATLTKALAAAAGVQPGDLHALVGRALKHEAKAKETRGGK